MHYNPISTDHTCAGTSMDSSTEQNATTMKPSKPTNKHFASIPTTYKSYATSHSYKYKCATYKDSPKPDMPF